jgi:energy-converting hydrogenase Eha subunit A
MAQIQALLLAYVDVIWMMVWVTALLIPLPFIMRRPKKPSPPVCGALSVRLLFPTPVLAHQFCQRHIGLLAHRR